MEEIKEFIMSPKIDYCFKELMKNELVRKGFIGALLNIDPDSIPRAEVLPTETEKDETEDKYGILDVFVELIDGEKIDMKMQVNSSDYWEERVVYYISKMITGQIKKGEDYDKIKKCIHVGILDFKLKNEYNEFCSRYRLWEDERDEIFSDVIEIYVIELPNIKEFVGEENALLKWAKFFNGETKKDFKEAAKGNKYIEEAYKELKALSEKEENRIAYERRQKVLLDHNSAMNYAKRKGIEQGIEQGRRYVIENALKKGKTLEEIADFMDVSVDSLKEYQNQL